MLLSFVIVLMSSCVSSSNLFQDGRTIGPDSVDMNLSVTIHSVPKYVSDTASFRSITDNHLYSPYAQFQIRFGLSKKFDVGGGFGLGAMKGAGGLIFCKYGLLPQESRTGMALLAHINLALSDLDLQNDDDDDLTGSIAYVNQSYSIPISFDLTKNMSIVLQPTYGRERITIRGDKDNPDVPKYLTRAFPSYRLGAGVIVKMKRVKVHYNVMTSYYPGTGRYAPSVGIGFTPLNN